MSSKKPSNYNSLPYEDLTTHELDDLIVRRRKTSNQERIPETLTGTLWIVECKNCGKERSCSGNSIARKTYKKCPCTFNDSDNGESPCGLGVIHLMEHHPSKFSEYIKRREEESRRSNCSKYNHNLALKSKLIK